jgi:hypothetical protein
VEALDKQGNYINFLNLQAAVVSPKGERQAVRLEQTGPGHYEARFPTREVGAYMVNLTEWQDGKVRGSQVIGATVNYSPEFNVTGPNLNLLRRVADSAGGKVLSRDDLSVNPFSHNRQKTFRARELWPWLLKLVIVLFVLDVGVRRIQIGREELQAMLRWAGRLAWWRTPSKPAGAEVSLAALLNKRNEVRSTQTASGEQAGAELLKPRGPVTVVLPGGQPVPKAPVPPPPTPAPAAKAPGTPAPAEGTTARLLEARRRAQKRHDKGGQ